MLMYNGPILQKFARRLDARVLLYQMAYELLSGVITPASERASLVLPNTIYVETGSFCRKRCRDCYVPVNDRVADIQLTERNLADITAAAKMLRVNYITILGGEPFDPATSDVNLRWMKNTAPMRYAVCTSGEGIADGRSLSRVRDLCNATLVFSLDGFQSTNDRIRGAGSFSKATEALLAYGENGRRLSGIIVTLRAENLDEVTSRDFLTEFSSKGAYYFEYGPYYTQESTHALDPEKYAKAIMTLMDASRKVPALIFSNHFGQIYGRAIDIGKRIHSITVDYRGFVYTARRGKAFGNINERSLLEIIETEDFQRLFRAKHREFDAAAVAATDTRYPFLFAETLRILEREGVDVRR
jgi:MoaA/NifB/PqqE/SkfB family radical SAM enzyme